MSKKSYLLTQAEVDKYLGTFNCDVCEVVKDKYFDCDDTLDEDYRCVGEREWLSSHEFNERTTKRDMDTE